MLRRLTLITGLALFVAFGLSTTASAAMIPIYKNSLGSKSGREDMAKHFGERCARLGNEQAMRVFIGNKTAECQFSPPVLGRDLDASVTGRLLSGTPRKLRWRSFLTVSVRAQEGSALQARVFPLQKKIQLIKFLPDDTRRFLAIEKEIDAIRGLNGANRIALRAFNFGEPGNCRIALRVNGARAALVDDPRCPQLKGRLTSIGIGSPRAGKGIVGSFNRLRIAVPNPFDL